MATGVQAGRLAIARSVARTQAGTEPSQSVRPILTLRLAAAWKTMIERNHSPAWLGTCHCGIGTDRADQSLTSPILDDGSDTEVDSRTQGR